MYVRPQNILLRSTSAFKKGYKEDPGTCRDITLLSVINKLFNSVSNNRLLKYLEINNELHEGQGV